MKKLMLIVAIAGGTLSMTAQNVGIGTTAPTNKLHVAGDLRVETTAAGAAADAVLVVDATGVVKAMPAGSAANVGADAKLGVNDEPWFNMATNAGANANTQNLYTMGGLVGIGTATPVYNLHIQRPSTAQLALEDTTGKLNIMHFIAGTEALFIKYGTNYSAGSIHGNGPDSFAIANAGDVSIASDINGKITMGGNTAGTSDVTMTVDNVNNRVGVGISAPAHKLDVDGNILARGNVYAHSSIYALAGTLNTTVNSTNGILGAVKLSGVNSTATYTDDITWRIYNMNEYGAYKGLSFWNYMDADGDGTLDSRAIMTMANNAGVAIGLPAPVARLDVNGYVKVSSSDAVVNAEGLSAGLIRFSGGHFQGYNGTAWVQLD